MKRLPASFQPSTWPGSPPALPAPKPPPLTPAGSPLAELLEDDPVGEALAADANAFQHPVATQLLQHQKGVQLARLQGQRGRAVDQGAGTPGAASPESQAWVTQCQATVADRGTSGGPS